ncbi:hypothetical protein GCM10027360_86860 [Amycolatopsis echigonensis]
MAGAEDEVGALLAGGGAGAAAFCSPDEQAVRTAAAEINKAIGYARISGMLVRME